MATLTATQTPVHLSSLVKRLPPLRPRKMKKYRLVYNHVEQTYNGGVEFDIEDSEFNVPQGHSPVIRDLAKRLAEVSKAIGRVYCFNKATPLYPCGMTTGFYIDKHHILTTSDLMEDDHGDLISNEELNFSFTLRISTKEWPRVQPTLMHASFVCKTDNLLLLRVSPPPIAMSPLLPYKEFMTTTKFDLSNTDPSYVNATSICVVGYCDGVSLPRAISDHSSLPANIQAITPFPCEADVERIPKDHKSLFPGRILFPVLGAPFQFGITASMHHGCCGSPVFCPADPTKFIGVVLAGAETANCNIILTVLSDEFDLIFTAIKNVV